MTYSIVARHPTTAELGVAVQSHYLASGAPVCWAHPGVGVVATQADVRVDYGPLGLQAMAEGKTPGEALAPLLGADPQASVRQVAFLDVHGLAAAHTGGECISWAGSVQGDGFSAQGNILQGPEVVPAMVEAYTSSVAKDRGLAASLLDALDAAEAAGGDLRGRQSAAVVVVKATRGEPWEGRLIDIRVDDHPAPLPELRRVVGLSLAYAQAERAESLARDGDLDRATSVFDNAVDGIDDSAELCFWFGRALVGLGHDIGAVYLERAFHAGGQWRELSARLNAAGR
jgi:uncharacterized Ntn-hydrolase superfamily protein